MSDHDPMGKTTLVPREDIGAHCDSDLDVLHRDDSMLKDPGSGTAR